MVKKSYILKCQSFTIAAACQFNLVQDLLLLPNLQEEVILFLKFVSGLMTQIKQSAYERVVKKTG